MTSGSPWLAAMREKLLSREDRRLSFELPELARAAVLLPLLADPGGPRVLFTVRSSGLRSHAGQIAFPGGRVDEGETLEEAALRETREEIGLSLHERDLWGRLDDQLSPARFVVTPLVAALSWPQAPIINPAEVDEIFTVPLAELRALTPHSEARVLYGLERRIHFYDWQKRSIWGMTANILKNFLELTEAT